MSRPYTQRDDAILLACYAQKVPLQEIAERLDRPYHSVSNRYVRLQRKARIAKRNPKRSAA